METTNINEVITELHNYAQNKNPLVVLLIGKIGAGKTYFINEFAKSIGITQQLVSPTLHYYKMYEVQYMQFSSLVHLDLYRIEKSQTSQFLEQISFWDYIKTGNIIAIEWPDNILTELKELKPISVEIDMTDNFRTYNIHE